MSTGVEVCFRTATFSSSLPSVVIALSEVVIDKVYLKWLDISKLLATFPEHVKVLGDNVIFQIVFMMSPWTRFSLQIFGGSLSCMFMRRLTTNKKRVIRSYFSDDKQAKLAVAVCNLVGILLSFGAGFYLTGRYLPTQAGVHFYGQPSFYV